MICPKCKKENKDDYKFCYACGADLRVKDSNEDLKVEEESKDESEIESKEESKEESKDESEIESKEESKEESKDESEIESKEESKEEVKEESDSKMLLIQVKKILINLKRYSYIKRIKIMNIQ